MEASAEEQTQKPKRGRPGRRSKFKMPHPAVPVKYLWEAASEEERKKAHQTGVAILELWLGKSSRAEAAEKLGMPLVRVWQLSKQALSGMVVGLLKQPKARKGVLKGLPYPEENTAQLKARIMSLEKQLVRMRSLVELIRQMPTYRKEAKGKPIAQKRRKKKKRSVAATGTGPANRPPASGMRADGTCGPESRGPSPRRERADGAQLDPRGKDAD